jgi:hypothetical protein
MKYEILPLPSNLSKSFCVNVLTVCGIECKYRDIFETINNHSILAEEMFISQAKIIIEQCSIVDARQWMKKK